MRRLVERLGLAPNRTNSIVLLVGALALVVSGCVGGIVTMAGISAAMGSRTTSSTPAPLAMADPAPTDANGSAVMFAPTVDAQQESSPTQTSTPSPSPPAATSTPLVAPASPSPPSTPSATGVALVSSNQLAIASVSDAAPAQNSRVTLAVKFTSNGVPISNAPMTATWHYKTSSPTCSGQTDDLGIATCTRNIGGATKGYQVTITVVLTWNGQRYTATTGFTPR